MCNLSFCETIEFQSLSATTSATSILLSHLTALSGLAWNAYIIQILHEIPGINITAILWNQALSEMTKISIHLENRCIVKVSVKFLKSHVELCVSKGEYKKLHSVINMYSRNSFTSLFELAIPNNHELGILHIIYLLFFPIINKNFYQFSNYLGA